MKIFSALSKLIKGRREKNSPDTEPLGFSITTDSSTGTDYITSDGKNIVPLSDLEELHDSREGSCFILASGPSAKEIDVDALGGIPIIAVKGAIHKFQDSETKPEFWVSSDTAFLKRKYEIFKSGLNFECQCFFCLETLSFVIEREQDLLEGKKIALIETVKDKHGGSCHLTKNKLFKRINNDPNLLVEKRKLGGHNRLVGFSRDISKGLFVARTATYYAVQIAYFLGFRNVFILGMDLSTSQGRHFYEESHGYTFDWNKHYDNHIKPAFETINRFKELNDFSVYNLSEKSVLSKDVLPKISLKDAFDIINS